MLYSRTTFLILQLCVNFEMSIDIGLQTFFGIFMNKVKLFVFIKKMNLFINFLSDLEI